MDEGSDDFDNDEGLSDEVMKLAEAAGNQLIPKNTGLRYEKVYTNFEE